MKKSGSKKSTAPVKTEQLLRPHPYSVVVNGSQTTTPAPMDLEVVTITANLTPPPGLPTGITALLPSAPTVNLQVSDGSGGWDETGYTGTMILVTTNQYTYTFPPVSPDDYRGYVYASWMLSGSIPDNGASAPIE